MNPASSAPSLLITGLGLDDQARALDAAEARYQTEIAALTRPDGKPLYLSLIHISEPTRPY